MMSFRMKIILFAAVVMLGGTFLILKGNWPLDKIGDTYTGINIPNDQSAAVRTSEAEPEDLRFALYETPRAVPDINFYTADGQQFDLSHWRGRKLIVNLWATWCAPCVEEMPRLDALKAILEDRGASYDVIAISIDRQKDFSDINRFFADHDITRLVPFMDTDSSVLTKMQISSFPVTYILNAQGMEITRYEGPLEWDNPKVVEALLKL